MLRDTLQAALMESEQAGLSEASSPTCPSLVGKDPRAQPGWKLAADPGRTSRKARHDLPSW